MKVLSPRPVRSPKRPVPGPARSRSCRRRLGLWTWLLLTAVLAAVAPAAESAAGPASTPLRYRRVFLSSEAIRRVESEALRDEAFVPLRREELEDLLGAVGTKYSAPQVASAPQITQATYTGLLSGELLAGSARLVIAPGADASACLALNPCNLVLSQPRWEPAEPSEAPADVAWGSDDTGQILATVNAPGVLQFAWSQRGVRNAADELTFDLRLPAAAVNQLQLSLRRDLRPVTETAVISRLEQDEEAAVEQTWQIALRGDMPLKLRLAPSSEPPQAQPLILLRQEQRYTVVPDAVEITVRLRLDVHQQPLSELTCELDETMRLYRAQYRDTLLEWSDTPGAAGRLVTLAMPEPLVGNGHEIRLQAVAAMDPDTAWQLPRLAVPGVFWLEGVSRLEVPEPWRIAHLQTEGGRQVQASPLVAPQRGESVEIREFQPRSQILALLRRAAGEMTVQTITNVTLGTAATTVVYDAQLTTSGPPQHSVELALLPGWSVDMVEAQPSDVLEDWQVLPGSPQPRTLQIHFRRPLAADHPLRLTLYAHRRGLWPGERLRGRDLRLARWPQATVSRSLMTIAAEASHQVALSGDLGLRRLAAEDLSGWEKERIPQAAGAVLYLEDPGADELTVALLEEMPAYSAEIHIDSTYQERWTEQTFRLRCQPIASKVARLVVHFSEPVSSALRWTLEGEEEGSVLARPLDGEGAAADRPGSVSWELILPRARDKVFELVATRTAAWETQSEVIPLVSLPAAASQVGFVTVRSATLPLTIEPQNVRPIPAEPPTAGSYTTTRGAFRFDPSLDCRLTVRMAEGVPRFGAVWAETGELSTRVSAAGQALHTAVYRLENRGQTQLAIGPPAESELLEILVNGRLVSGPRQPTASRARVVVELPRGDRDPVLLLRYAASFPRRGPWGTLTALWPDLGIPVFARQWLLSLPPGWQLESPQDSAEADWTRRLFGPLLRPSRQPRFVPLDWRHWASPEAWADSSTMQAVEPDGRRLSQALAEEDPNRGQAPEDAASPSWDAWEFPQRGWTTTRLPMAGAADQRWTTGGTQIRVFQREFFVAAGWAAFLANVGLMVWWTWRRPLWCLPLSALWGGVALAVPATWVPVASGCFLASLLSVLLVWLLPAVPPPGPSAETPAASRLVLTSATTGVLVFLLVVFAAVSAAAQAPRTGSVAEADKVYRVLFPVDDEQQPTEPYVYVPREFWNRLRREASGAGSVSRQWLITAADYRLVFESDGIQPLPQPRELTVQFRVRTYRAGVRLVLPIRQDQVYLLPNRARLDGRPASVAWESEGQTLVVEIPELGETTLELAFRPQVELQDGMLRCDVRIPPVPDARLRLQLPADAPAVECLSAWGNVTSEPTGERLIALGPADRLTLQWPADPGTGTGTVPVEAEQWMWLRIRPGAVVLEARFRYTSPANRLREISVLASPRLRLLPNQEAERAPVISADNGENQRLRWPLKGPAVQEANLNLAFVLTDAAGIGVVRLPRLEAIANRTSRRWLGVSVDESLSYEAPLAGTGETVDPLAFAAAWETGAAPPQIAVAIPDGEPMWSVATQPRPLTIQAAQRLEISWGADRADLQFQAELDAVSGSVFEYRLDVPPGLEIRSVSIRQQEDVQTARWAHVAEGTLIVRGNRAVTGKHRLEIQAALSAPRTGEQTVKRIGIQGAEILSDSVSLYRRAAVRVTLLDRAGLNDVPEAVPEQYRPGWGRRIASLAAAPNSPRTATPLRVAISPNRPRPQGTLVTILERQQDAWQVQAQYDLRVDGGLVDAVRFEIPAEWTGPLSCDCAGELELLDVPGQKRRHLVLCPPQAIAASQRLTISGKLATPQGEAVQAPDIIPLDAQAAERYLCAPTQINQQGIAWKTSGLREIAELPAGFQPPSGPHQVFVATQPRFRATIADVQSSPGLPRIVLADIHVTCSSDGNLAGTATFDLQPSGIDHCELELPEEYHLVHVAFGGLPAMLDSREPQRWRLTFGPRQLAQQVQVVFHGRMRAVQAGRRTLLAPRLVGIPVEQTLWTLRSTDATPLHVVPAEDRVDPIKLESIRFATRAELIESGSDAVAAADPSVAARWYPAWFQLLAKSRSRIEQWSADRPAVRARYAQELQQLEAVQTRLDERLKSLPPPARATVASAQPPPAAWQRERQDGAVLALATRADAIEVEFVPTTDLVAEQRAAVAAILLALAAVAWMLLPHPLLHRWSQLLLPSSGIVLGGLWWFWCTPSVLGLFLALLSLLIAYKRWHSQRGCKNQPLANTAPEPGAGR
jgi:hypothetical protein